MVPMDRSADWLRQTLFRASQSPSIIPRLKPCKRLWRSGLSYGLQT